MQKLILTEGKHGTKTFPPPLIVFAIRKHIINVKLLKSGPRNRYS
jgi:hypothetical protein